MSIPCVRLVSTRKEKDRKMKVYATAVSYEGIYDVFSTLEKAIASATENIGLGMYVLEIEIDNPSYNKLVWSPSN
jgi:hypothetical protein